MSRDIVHRLVVERLDSGGVKHVEIGGKFGLCPFKKNTAATRRIAAAVETISQRLFS